MRLYCFVQPSSDAAGAVCVELFPAQESTALKTLLEAAVKSSIPESINRGSAVVDLNEVSCDLPVPSPKPTPTLVSQCSMCCVSSGHSLYMYVSYFA